MTNTAPTAKAAAEDVYFNVTGRIHAAFSAIESEILRIQTRIVDESPAPPFEPHSRLLTAYPT